MGLHRLVRWGACGLLLSVADVRAAAGPLSSDGLWADVVAMPQSVTPANVWVNPLKFRAVTLDRALMEVTLMTAPAEGVQPLAAGPTIITLPLPDGTYGRFRIEESPVMPPALAAQFPEIKTYIGQGLDDPTATARLDLTPAGFHAQVLTPQGSFYIDPHLRDASVYASYYRQDARRNAEQFTCGFDPATHGAPAGLRSIPAGLRSVGTQLRTYRTAVAATGEYTAFHGGTTNAGLAAIVTMLNRVTGVYEIELSVRLVLVTNNHRIVYTVAASDPYTNEDGGALLDENQANLDTIIGAANYDLGHVVGTGGGGLAAAGVCSSIKAQGETGSSSPINDSFYIDYVAHEMGHQFGANHTFNSSLGACNGNRAASVAYEPGSGSSIMAYAGICSTDNLQPNSDPNFHSGSFDEITAFIGSGTCSSNTATGNSIPTVSAGAAKTIPKGTPFRLTATASDANGDTLTYLWEERDLGPSTTVTAPDNGSSPIFRAFAYTTNAWRSFPRLQDLLYPTNAVGEQLPQTARTMNFRVTVRDHRAGGGGVNVADTQVAVATNAGPFAVTSQGGGGRFTNTLNVTWNVANTTNTGVNCQQVRIALSTNGGFAFPFTLAVSTPNDGAETVILPGVVSTNARVRVEAADNVFFAISTSSFAITGGTPQAQMLLASAVLSGEQCAPTNGAVDPAEPVTVQVTLSNVGAAATANLTATLLATNGVALPGAAQTYGVVPAGAVSAARSFSFVASAACGESVTCVLRLQDGTNDLGTVSQSFAVGANVATVRAFTNATALTIPQLGNASVYPSTLSVSGLSGNVANVTATLRGLSHTYPDDVDVLLVSPGGQKVMLMSDAGGDVGVTGVTLTFDDTAGSAVTDGSGLVSGNSYKPADYEATDTMTSPAPGRPYGTSLSAFNGAAQNGTWSLYVLDDTGGDSGSIAQGWSLTFTMTQTVCCAAAPVPAVAGFAPTGPAGAFVMPVTNAVPFSTNYVLASTNLLLPLGQWSRIATNIAGTNGIVVFTNAVSTNITERFFLIQRP